MRFSSAAAFHAWPNKAVTLFGMSGVGKTWAANQLRSEGWFHYSVDYRIGTRYMGEHIVDNFKREAMQVPLLRKLLLTDSIYISSNISFANLSPLSTYLGKPGRISQGGLPFEDYIHRQRQHRDAEISAMSDVPVFIEKARQIYRYDHFICDASGSLCEVVDPADPDDAVLSVLARNTVLVYIRGTERHVSLLIERFRRDPKPIYYNEPFLRELWNQYCKLHGAGSHDDIDPDAFAVWAFEKVIHHRLPIYEEMAQRHGYVIEADDVMAMKNGAQLVDAVAGRMDD